MPRKSKAEIHGEILAKFDAVQTVCEDERRQCLEDRRFYSIAGAQWEGPLAEQFENKPKFEVNKALGAVTRIISEYRNNRMSVLFVPKDGSKDDGDAETLQGLFRADEIDSGAQEAYDNAFEEAVGGGYGAIRLRATYEDEEDDDNDYQRIRIEPVFDADSTVFFDVAAKRQDKADAKWCMVLTAMSYDDYRAEWDKEPATIEKAIDSTEFDWVTPDLVYIGEFYQVEAQKESIQTWVSLTGETEKMSATEAEERIQELLATGWTMAGEKKVTRKKVIKYIVDGSEILEDCGYIAGSCIPVVPVYGKRWYIDGIERCMGEVRPIKDIQRLKNMQISKLAEISALSSVEKPILTPEQVSGHQMLWAEDNVKNYPYLLLNPVTGADGNPMPAGPMGYTKPPQIAPAQAALLQITEADIADILGTNKQGDQMLSNVSAKAVELVQNRADSKNFLYMDNFAKAVRRVGEVWLSMAKELYTDEGRKMKTVGKNDETGSVELMRPVISGGEMTTENDLTKASFDVAVDVGPSFTSRKDATVRALTGMMGMTQDPEMQSILQGVALMNMTGEGLTEVKDFVRKRMVRMGVMPPTDEEKQAMEAAGQVVDPQVQALEAMANEANANAAKDRASIIKTMAEAEKTKAQTAEIMVGLGQ